MKNKYIIKISTFCLSALLLLGTACTGEFEKYNTDDGGATSEEMNRDMYALRAAMTGMQSWVVPLSEHASQFIDCLLGGSFGGYFADSNNGFNGKNYSTYNPEEHWVQAPFNDPMKEIFVRNEMVESLSTDGISAAVSNIIKVLAISRVTDIYGPIPYSKVGSGGELNAPYDSQEQVYLKMFEELDAAIKLLTANRTATFNPLADFVYDGNVEQWIKLANSQKLRMAIRVSRVSSSLAQIKAEEAVNHEVGVITSNSDNAFMPVVAKNPYRVVMYEYNDGDSRISADITSYMNGYNDPRREKYFTLSNFGKSAIVDGYHGLRSGIQIPGGTDIKLYSNMNVDVTSDVMWMNAAEIAFLRAEGALLGWNMGGTAESFYNQGIELSFEQWGASGAAQYMENSVSTPATYVDPLGAFSYDKQTSTVKIKWDASGDKEVNLEQIITQKWIANFPLGLEAWAEYRRTGYPKLMPVEKNDSGGTVTTSRMARRLAYPQVEYNENRENVEHAVSQYLKGPDNMGTDLWWAKKN